MQIVITIILLGVLIGAVAGIVVSLAMASYLRWQLKRDAGLLLQAERSDTE